MLRSIDSYVLEESLQHLNLVYVTKLTSAPLECSYGSFNNDSFAFDEVIDSIQTLRQFPTAEDYLSISRVNAVLHIELIYYNQGEDEPQKAIMKIYNLEGYQLGLARGALEYAFREMDINVGEGLE